MLKRLRVQPGVWWSRLVSPFPGIGAAIANSGWLLLDRVLRVVVGLAVGVWVARYLGPAEFGALSYVGAVVALFGPLATLGLGGVVVRDLVRKPEDAPVLLGTALLLQCAGSLCAFLGVLATIELRAGEPELLAMAVALASALLFRPGDIVKYWFEAVVQTRYVVMVEGVALLVFAAARVVAIKLSASVIAFAWIATLEVATCTAALYAVYRRIARPTSPWVAKRDVVRRLGADAWPLLFSGFAVLVYMRIDQVMLGQMAGDEAVGIYSAALRVSEIWYAFPLILVGSLFPALVKAKATDPAQFDLQWQRLLNFLGFVAIVIAVVVSLSSGWIIGILYGAQFEKAGPILAVHVWAGVFVFVGVAGERWCLLENLQRISLSRMVVGAIVNVVLNLKMIPAYGAYGAAVATVASQAVGAYFLDAVSPKTRPLFRAKTLALLGAPVLWRKL